MATKKKPARPAVLRSVRITEPVGAYVDGREVVFPVGTLANIVGTDDDGTHTLDVSGVPVLHVPDRVVTNA